MALRNCASAVLPLALVALAACSGDSIVAPTSVVEVGVSSDNQDWTIARLQAGPELSGLLDAGTPHLLAEAERMLRGEPRVPRVGTGPQRGPPPVDPSLSPQQIVAGILFQVTLLLYEHGFFADATGDPRLDRAIAIIHPIHYAAVGLVASDSDQAVAGLEATIEWYEQRNAEGLVPDDIARWLIDYANIAIDGLGGSNATMTMCLTSAERSCVTAELRSVRWVLGSLKTRFRHDFSYTFLDGEPAQVEVSFRLVTGAPNCDLLGSPIANSGDAIGTVLVRDEPGLTANPNTGGATNVPCVPHGVIRGFHWDGFVVRDGEGAVLGSCGKSSGSPCFEPAA